MTVTLAEQLGGNTVLNCFWLDAERAARARAFAHG
jgi:hypothetical protein